MEMVACGGTTTKNMYAESPPQPLKVLGIPLVEALWGLVRAERLPARAQLDGLVGDTVGLDVGLHVSPTPVGLCVGDLPQAQHALATFGPSAPHDGCHPLPVPPSRVHQSFASYVAHVPYASLKPGVSAHEAVPVDRKWVIGE